MILFAEDITVSIYLVLFGLISSGGVFAAAYGGDASYEEALPITVSALVLILFAGSIFSALPLMVYMALGMAVCLYIASGYLVWKRKSVRSFLRALCTPASVMFAGAFFFLAIINRGRIPYYWDEFSHWGTSVKWMFSLDALYTSPLSNAGFKSYPPGMALFQYFCLKIQSICSNSNVFDQGMLYFAYQVFSLSFMFLFLRGIRWRRFIVACILLGAALLCPMVFYGDFYHNLMIDASLGLVAGCGWAAFCSERRKKPVVRCYICMCIAMTVLFKDAGLLLGGFLMAGFVIEVLYDDVLKKEHSRFAAFGWCAAAIAAVVLPKVFWAWHLGMMNAEKVFSNPVHIGELFEILFGESGSYKKDVLLRYMTEWMTKRFAFAETGVGLRFITVLLAVFVFVLIVFELFNKKDAENNRRGLYALLLFALNLCYCVGLCVMYMFKFSREEALELASFGRYVNIIFLLDFSMGFMLLIRKTKGMPTHAALLVLTISTALVSMNEVEGTISGRIRKEAIWLRGDSIWSFKGTAERIPAGSKVCVVTDEDSPYHYLDVQYEMIPCRVEVICAAGMSEEESRKASLKRAIDAGCEYVYLTNVNEETLGELSCYMLNSSEMNSMTLYSIDQESGLLKLVE